MTTAAPELALLVREVMTAPGDAGIVSKVNLLRGKFTAKRRLPVPSQKPGGATDVPVSPPDSFGSCLLIGLPSTPAGHFRTGKRRTRAVRFHRLPRPRVSPALTSARPTSTIA
ncbi:hypothetical protein GCM10022214_38590 [Actinomadura miaoliensis]|uniref:Uncharacterized protein n=1 Tax=Actinomadura miaoliensis TaxID=430685 RepID=A0ABP7W127_9ACTN